MRAAALLAVALAAAATLGSGGNARAADVTLGYQLHPDGGRQLSGVPIGSSEFDVDVTGPVGPVLLGSEIQAFQTGRAGLVSDVLQAHVGRDFASGRVTFTPTLILGYARALNDDFGVLGVEGRVAYQQTSALSTEVSARWRHSFAVNALPLNAAQLPHTAWHELALQTAQVLRVSPGLALGVSVRRDFGTIPDTAVGFFVRIGLP